MNLTAAEAMQALLDGKTLCDNIYRYWRMDDRGRLQMKMDDDAEWIESDTIWNDACKIWEEYSLTYEQALRAMLDGKIVENEYKFGRYRFDKGFEYSSICDWQPCVMDVALRNYKWKVVK